MNRRLVWLAPALVALLVPLSGAQLWAQERPGPPDRTSGWLIAQAVPGMTWTLHDDRSSFAFEWEAAPVLYSFSMTKLVSPWNFFFVTPPARFSGSIELVLNGRLFIRKVDRSYWGSSAALVGHLPLIERGEYLGLTLGIARHWFGDRKADAVVGGVSVLFGFIEYNVHYGARGEFWMHQIAIRMF